MLHSTPSTPRAAALHLAPPPPQPQQQPQRPPSKGLPAGHPLAPLSAPAASPAAAAAGSLPYYPSAAAAAAPALLPAMVPARPPPPHRAALPPEVVAAARCSPAFHNAQMICVTAAAADVSAAKQRLTVGRLARAAAAGVFLARASAAPGPAADAVVALSRGDAARFNASFKSDLLASSELGWAVAMQARRGDGGAMGWDGAGGCAVWRHPPSLLVDIAPSGPSPPRALPAPGRVPAAFLPGGGARACARLSLCSGTPQHGGAAGAARAHPPRAALRIAHCTGEEGGECGDRSAHFPSSFPPPTMLLSLPPPPSIDPGRAPAPCRQARLPQASGGACSPFKVPRGAGGGGVASAL